MKTIIACLLLSLTFTLCAQEIPNEKELAKQAVIHYKNREYSEALVYLEKITPEYRFKNPELNYYLVLSHMETRNLLVADAWSKVLPVKTPKKMPLFEAELLRLKMLLQKYDSLIVVTEIHVRDSNFSNAVKSINEALETDSFRVMGYYARALVHMKDTNYLQAIADFEKVLGMRDPDDAVTFYNIAFCHFMLGNLDPAIDRFTESLKLDTSALAYYYRANAFIQKEDFNRAMGDLDSVIKLDPDHSHAYYLRGWLSKNKGDCRIAIFYLEEAEQGIRNNVQLIEDIASCYEELGKLESAIHTYDRLIDLDPNNAHYWYSRGFSTSRNGFSSPVSHIAAMKYYNKAISLDSTNAEYYFQKAVSIRMLYDYMLAIDYLDKAIAFSPGEFRFYDERNLNHKLMPSPFSIRKKHLYQGIRNINALEKDTLLKYLHMAKLYTLVGEFIREKPYNDTAMSYLNRAVSLRNSDDAYFARAELNRDMGRQTESIADYKRAIEINPGNFTAHVNLGLMLKSMNKTEQALQVFKDAQILFPDNQKLKGYVKEIELLKKKQAQ
jgi:tetratricopeptide (TPR) repeat protein